MTGDPEAAVPGYTADLGVSPDMVAAAVSSTHAGPCVQALCSLFAAYTENVGMPPLF